MIEIKQRIPILIILLILISGCSSTTTQITPEEAQESSVIQEVEDATTEMEDGSEASPLEPQQPAQEIENAEVLERVILFYNEGYNFKENKKYENDFPKVDIMFGEIGGGDEGMLETRSPIYDNGIVGLEEAKPAPENHFYTFYIPEKNHVYSFKLWSMSEDPENFMGFEDLPDIAIRIIEVTEESVTFEYALT